MVWYGMVILYLMTLAPTAIADFHGGRQNVNYLQEGKKRKKYLHVNIWCDHNYHLAIISSNNILKLVDRFGYLCVKREAIPQFSPTIIETFYLV